MLQQMDYVRLDSKSLPVFSLPLSKTDRIIKQLCGMIYITLNFLILFFSVLNFPNNKYFQRNEQDEHRANKGSQKQVERLFWFRPNADG